MITMAVLGVLIGMIIGLRYRVLALLPIEMLGVAVVIVACFLASPGVAVLQFVVWSCALQFGYLITALLGSRQNEPSRSLANQH